ncbi:UDP-N-acetylmuramoyl-L-alanine--D-glutamate ligase [Lacrimispora sp. 210928-DFI.3.58]|uniref:UDP-N-acetylmuramoyl-L-alanine--D-glutamate ligase n=1 Tax=Lacrimispora sp. 210928-DFI.3.58 TaxID=2883214 RepID=UPI0015B581E4|nr:UDP-N-acetylmuramoyl-L-alanine--D-glutamate ligase [Lacrimispora sp. 210928-DFI.3.58]MCB7318549.1 UDP-N-acetylmuramoyl-L-alanine--D-glutamate ligase [Lacrimispora sp. 210928-DFI.3.58]
MIEKIEPWIKGKRVLLLGFGREGQSTFHLLKKLGGYEKLDIADISSPGKLPDEETLWISGPDYQKCLDNYDVVFKSPGIVLERPAEEYRCRILSQTEVFFHCFRDQIIGITGTKGKSTITTLLYHLLKSAGMDTLLAGNIGIPAFDHIEEVGPDTRIVFELSCHQLEYMTVSPHIGILVNIHEEHLDHYGTMEKYVEAKHHIFTNQKESDILICNVQCLPKEGTCSSRLIEAAVREQKEEEYGERAGGSLRAAASSKTEEGFGNTGGSAAAKNREAFSGMEVIQSGTETVIAFEGRRYSIPVNEIKLLGQHNYFDIGIAYVVCSLLGMEDEVFTQGLKTYEPLPHRLQLLGVKDGIRYYDDSISTICDTTIQALRTLTDTDTVLIGGMDRGIDYGELIGFLSQCPVPHIILMEATGKRIYEEIRNNYPDFGKPSRLVLAEHLEDAVRLGQQLTRPGHSLVLSPAAASYGIFKNFEERGKVFARLVFG